MSYDRSTAAPAASAPWTLRGNAWVLVFHFPPTWVAEQAKLSAALNDRFVGGLGAVMLVDYHHTPAGPYQELLFIPGAIHWHGRRYSTIARHYVSHPAARQAAQENWGIPSTLAEFAWQPTSGGVRVQVRASGTAFASLHLSAGGPRLPFTSNLLPSRRRSLLHVDGERNLLTSPAGRGWIRTARLLESHFDPNHFPDISHQVPVVAVQALGFTLLLPKAQELNEDPPR